jgi:hypothetical protein
MLKVTITNRKGLLTWFNKFNSTEHPASCYTGVEIVQQPNAYTRAQLVFKHNNGVGCYRISLDNGGWWTEGDGEIQKFVNQ